MARLVSSGSFGFNMDTFHVGDLLDTFFDPPTPTHLVLTSDALHPVSNFNDRVDLYGSGIDVLTGGVLLGTITRFELLRNFIGVPGDVRLQITNFSMSVQQFAVWSVYDDNQGMFSTILSGADTMLGSISGADLLRGYDGDDTIAGYGGQDTIFGGLGADTIHGGSPTGGIVDANNYLRGDEGNDSVTGYDVFDDINGNMGNDTCYGGGGTDWVVGGKDNDLLYGELPRPDPFANPGDDLVYGNLGDDTCYGGFGADIVRGGQGNDVLFGDQGRDFMSGDRGDDTVTGGADADVFHSFAGAGLDRVLDFNGGEGDRIQLDAGTTWTVRTAGADTVIDMGNGDQMILVGVSGFQSAWITVL
ncbi:MAG TPA: calcium-binding protein [Phenylobacterium sp.]